MAASSDLQALQLENRNLQQKLDWKQLKINELETKVRDLRGGGLAADLGRLERSIGRLSLLASPAPPPSGRPQRAAPPTASRALLA